jgi:hypothetical protein
LPRATNLPKKRQKSKQMTLSAERPASHIDYAEDLQTRIPATTLPYVLARLALNSNSHPNDRYKEVQSAAVALHEANQQGILEPPLNPILADELGAMIEQYDKGRWPNNPADRMLLAWALSNEATGGARG